MSKSEFPRSIIGFAIMATALGLLIASVEAISIESEKADDANASNPRDKRRYNLTCRAGQWSWWPDRGRSWRLLRASRPQDRKRSRSRRAGRNPSSVSHEVDRRVPIEAPRFHKLFRRAECREAPGSWSQDHSGLPR